MAGRWKEKKVAVIMGGISREREIALRTGNAIADGLDRRGYAVRRIDYTDGAILVQAIEEDRPDVALIALHGRFGEDGCVQGLLEVLRIPYTGAGVMGSAVAMDKAICNRLVEEMGIPIPHEVCFQSAFDDAAAFAADLNIDLPVVVKPAREGSTINMSIVHARDELAAALSQAAQSDAKILVERYIAGREVTVGLINGRALTPLEIAPKGGFYDYASKYTKGMTEYIVPARIDADVAGRLQGWSETVAAMLECEGTARADFIVPDEGGEVFLEINTIPGMTELSLVPMAAAYEGLSFDDVCEELLDGARLKVLV